MIWTKLGHIFAPDGTKRWMQAYAANPVAEMLHDDVVRIYFSSRDEKNRSSVGFVEIDLKDPQRLLRESQMPVLGPGDLAMFDDSGISLGSILPVGRKRYLYYMGWHLTVTVPWQNSIGLAISDGPDLPFRRVSRFPIMGLNDIDPCTMSYPWVVHDQGKFRMWYGSSTVWSSRFEDMRHPIKYAESDDGIHWERKNIIAVDCEIPGEYALTKPCVIKDGDVYKMWFGGVGPAYRIFYAESLDGVTWKRMPDPAPISVSPGGWDSQMIAYPCVFDHAGERYMLYVGNDFGRAGFGLARLDR